MNFREFFTTIRGYSMPMSILNWLVAFLYTIKLNQNYSVLYGILALLGIVFAHIGTNIFDDFIDTIFKTNKQNFKTTLIKQGKITVKILLLASLFCFLASFFIGLFFFIKYGFIIFWLCFIAGVIILLYPRLNHIALGEVAVGLCFGILMFFGISYVMLGNINSDILLISIPVGILTSSVVYVHNYLDFDFDKSQNKNTLCVILGNKKRARALLALFYTVVFVITLYLIFKGILGNTLILSFFLLPYIIKLIKELKINSDFLQNFKLARNISLVYNLILILGLIC